MVNYYLKENTDEKVIYEYYPEDDKSKQAGIITIDKINEKIQLTRVAEQDSESYAPEFNERWWRYYDHAQRQIVRDYNNGEIKDYGMVAWY